MLPSTDYKYTKMHVEKTVSGLGIKTKLYRETKMAVSDIHIAFSDRKSRGIKC